MLFTPALLLWQQAELADARAERRLCIVCMEKPKDTAFQCGHQLCAVCASRQSMCPFCREKVDMRIKLY